MAHQRVDVKVVLLGKEYGGKTSLVERFIHERFNANQPYQNVSKVYWALYLCTKLKICWYHKMTELAF